MNETPEETPATRVKLDTRDIVIATTVVVATVSVLNVAAHVAAVPLRKLTDKLNRKNEETKTK